MRFVNTLAASIAMTVSAVVVIACQGASDEDVASLGQPLVKAGAGDVDGDGSVTIVDSMLVAQYGVGNPVPETFNAEVADVNCDGDIDIMDSMLLSQASVGLYDVEPENGDVDADGVLTGTDAMVIAQLSVGIEVPGRMNQCAADVNCDGRVDSVDGLLLVKALSGQIELNCWQPGDVNGDGSLSPEDSLLVAQYAEGMDPEGFIAPVADVNCDDAIDDTDATMISEAYVGSRDLQPVLGDVDADGQLTSTDTMIIAQLSVGNDDQVPATSNQCVADVNCDGTTDAVDQLLSAKASVGLIELNCWQLGDVDGDGIVTADDARYIAMYASDVDGVPEHFIAPMADVDCDGDVDLFDSAATSEAVSAGTVPTCE